MTSSPSRPADPDVAADLLDGAGVDQRPDVDGLVEAGAEAERPRRGARAARAAARRPARSTTTRLAAVQRWPVVPNADQRMPSVARSRSASAMTTIAFLPPSSRLTRLSLPAGPLGDAPAGRRRAGERDDRGRPGCRRSRRRPRRRAPVTRLTVPAGKPASAISSTRSVAQWGVSLDGLKTTVLPGDERRHHLPARDRHREVPGRDDPGDPDRLADAHRPLVGQLARDRVAEHPAPLAGHQEGDVDPLLDVAAGLGEDLAHLAGHRPGEALLVLGHQRAEAVQDLAALRGRRPAPQPAGHVGGPDAIADVRGGPLLEPPDRRRACRPG